ncbi:hypothetical protein FGO68_gene10433 [Halteria grandinella]|uniref:Uncharacterized protein n=1 Tax=Halteria grandinella TaxID=5974 RepID=A0A8J8NVI5_HALGN|nr:hypothetical protein FGO68_gene10433 [Halteria grandinella]
MNSSQQSKPPTSTTVGAGKAPSRPQTTPAQKQPAPQNKLFQLNKQIILTARKLETGPLENYVHMATLIHKLNLLLLEFDSIKQLRNILRIIYSKPLLNSLLDFSMNADQFAHFGIRLLELLTLEFHKEIAKSEVLQIIFGLLRTNDYETIVQCLSFVKVLLQTALAEQGVTQAITPGIPALIKVGDILNKKLLVLMMKTVLKQPEIEHVSILIDIVNLVLTDKDQRVLILDAILKEEDPATTLIDDEAGPYNYRRMLRNIEGQVEIRSVKALHKKLTRQLKEVEMWAKSKGK